MIKVAAATFSVDARRSSTGRSQLNAAVSHIFTPLKSSVFLIEQDGDLIAAAARESLGQTLDAASLPQQTEWQTRLGIF